MGRGTRTTLLLACLVSIAVGGPSEAARAERSSPPLATSSVLDVGRSHACAILASASVRCWGYGVDGALGYADARTIGDDETPGAAGPVDLGAGRTAKALSAGDVHTCALLDDGAVRCWGFGPDGRLGYASPLAVGDDEPPGSVGPVVLGARARAVSAGGAHSCAVVDDGSVRCWGYGFDGRLGYGERLNIGDDEAPAAAGPVELGTGRTAQAITAGGFHTCALLDDGTVRCWGLGRNGQLGYASAENIGDDELPDAVRPVELGRPAVALSAGEFHTCALLDDGAVRCWGFGGNGRLGSARTASIGDDETPDSAEPVSLGRPAVSVSAGGDHTCALLDDATVRCWGFGGNGRLGYANTASIGDNETPASAGPIDLGAGRSAQAISAGSASTCASLDDGSVRCWGDGANGRLGYCNTETIGDDETPGAAGPVDLGVAGSPGAGCATVAPPAVPPPAGVAPPAPPALYLSPGPPPAPGAPTPLRRLMPDDGLAAQRARTAALRGCLREASRRGVAERSRARRLAGSKRRSTLRRIIRRAASRRRSCRKRHGRTPGRVTTLRARATGRRAITLSFRTTGTDASRPPAARRYLIKQSRRPIRSGRDFRRARSLCNGACSFEVTDVGEPITLTVTDLRRRSGYSYAVAARDNVSARAGRRSKAVQQRTR